MIPQLLSLLLSQAALDHGIYGGFNPQWVMNANTLGQVALSVGSAVIDGTPVTNDLANGYPADSTPITPTGVPANTAAGTTYVAYCYILDIALNLGGDPWFATAPNGHTFKFMCMVNPAAIGTYAPTNDGHPPGQGIPFPVAGNPNLMITAALFVGSVVGTQEKAGALYGGANPLGFSVNPFFRNGSQVIYATSNICTLNCFDSNWDLGLPSNQPGLKGSTQLAAPGGVGPNVLAVDFTKDGTSDALPLSASAVILDSEAYAHQGDVATMCFLDPNAPVPNNPSIQVGNQQRSCQSELQVDVNNGNATFYRPLAPFRTHLNPGYGAGGYGKIWIGCTSNTNGGAPNSMLYFDLAYRGYVEPERQLLPQAP